MEKRLIAAIILSVLVLLGYQLLFVKPKTEVEAQSATSAVQPPPPPALESGRKPPAAAAEPRAQEPAPEAVRPAVPEAGAIGAEYEEEIEVDTPLYSAVWSNKGGVLRSWKLKEFKNDRKEDLELVSALAAETGQYPFSLSTDDPAVAAELNSALFRAEPGRLTLGQGQDRELKFAYSDGKSLRAEKTYRFDAGTYQMEIDVRVWKDGQEIAPYLLWGPGIGNPTPEEMKHSYSAARGAAVFTGGKVYRMDERKYKPEQSSYNFVTWAAFEDNYFAAIFVPPAQKGQAAFLKEAVGEQGAYFLAVNDPRAAYIGPKSTDLLRSFGHDTRRIVNFGIFGSIAEILLAVVKFFHGLVPNWGLDIILLTIVIKIIFFPLTWSSTKSMARMAELQPKIKALRAKYKKAKTDIAQRRQMNEEMMKLYKEHGVNPAGGCLPLLIQLPVFWGVFRMLVVSVDFRHAPFIFWIQDLSMRDPYYVTPVLMGATQFISQKMTPTSADPSQARMMLIMPVIMTIFFMNFQSGLVLYWLTTNVLQIGQQALMNRWMAKQKKEANVKRR